MSYLLDESISFASAGHRISMQINKFKFTEDFEDLFDVWFRKIEVQRPDIKS